jgi:hypothetical protein
MTLRPGRQGRPGLSHPWQPRVIEVQGMRAPPIGPVPDAGSWMLDPQPTRRRLVDLTWCTWRAHPPETLRCFAAQGDIQAALPRPARLHVILSELRPERPERAKDPLKPGRRRELIVAPEIGGDSSSPLPAPCFALRRDRSRLLRMTVADGCSPRIPRARQAPREVLKRIGVRVLTKHGTGVRCFGRCSDSTGTQVLSCRPRPH